MSSRLAGLGRVWNRARAAIAAQPRGVRWLLWLAALEAFYLLFQWMDTLAFTSLRRLGGARSVLDMFKSAGFLPVWLLGALALVLCDWGAVGRVGAAAGRRVSQAWRRGAVLLGGAATSMVVAEVLKLVVRRERPQAWLDVAPVFRDWSGAWWQSNDLGMPSSHAATAFGAAFALSRMFPAATPAWLAIAVGCALSRVVEQAHTLTDVYAGGVCAWLVVAALWRLFPPRGRD